MATDRYPEGKFACVLCGHDVAIHGLIVGCDACSCAATPGEASYNAHVSSPYDGEILPATHTRLHYTRRPVYGQSLYLREDPSPPKVPSITEGGEAITCPTCNGSGQVAYGRYGKRPPKRECRLCNGKGQLFMSVAEVFRVGVEMGRSSAYLGRYDQYDTGSLMFSDVDSPYEPGVEIKGEVNGRTGF